jgi:CubicO group peptidase (beta-lactamase class C family)
MNVASSVRAADVVRAGLGTRYTAALLRVERAGSVAFEAAFGTLDATARARATEVTTRFDLASLTKVYAGAAALFAVADGAVALDEPVARLLPEWRDTAHGAITPRMLLAHTSGMQSGADYRTLLGENVERFALARPLAAAPGERVIYSDLGFIAVGVLLARARGMSLARVMADACARLGCSGTAFRPRNDAPETIPATECDAWRGRVRGAVHDEKAYLMHGVAGHAGLFGTARDAAALAEAFLGPLHGRASALPAHVAREAIAEHGADPVLRRGLAWALKTSDENSCGAAMSRATFGHTGFTGTCLWADPARDLSVVLQTNAVYFGRNDMRDVRAAVCDACVAEFG